MVVASIPVLKPNTTEHWLHIQDLAAHPVSFEKLLNLHRPDTPKFSQLTELGGQAQDTVPISKHKEFGC